MTSFAQSCRELVDQINKWDKDRGFVHDIVARDFTRKERLARAKDEVAFLESLYKKYELIQLAKPIIKRIADLEEGIAILEGVK